MHIGGAVLGRKRRNLGAKVCPVGVWIGVSCILVVVVGGETDAGFVGTDGCGHGFDDFEGESATIFNGTSIGVGSGVDVIMEELFEEVAVCTTTRVR